jgi:hypothetical protein
LQTSFLQHAGSQALDEFTQSQPTTLIYSSSNYIRLIAQETMSNPYWIVVSDSTGIRAALPLLVKQGKLGPVVNSLAYFGSNGAIITRGDDIDAKLAVLTAYIAFCTEINACASTLITNPLVNDRKFYEENLPHDLLDERIGQFTYFPDDCAVSTLLSSFENPRPRNIRKAQRLGISVFATQSDEAIEFLHKTHDKGIRGIGGLPKSLEFFRSIPQILPGNAWNIYLAEFEGQYIAALLLFYNNRTVEYFTPCAVDQFRSFQALPLLIFEAMSEAMSRGYAQWNWGGTWLSQDGVYAFKKKWGTTDIPYNYFTRLHSESVLSAGREMLLEEYKGFFVLPFSALQSTEKAQETI